MKKLIIVVSWTRVKQRNENMMHILFQINPLELTKHNSLSKSFDGSLEIATFLIDTNWIWLDAGSPVGPNGYVNFQGDGSTDNDNICAHTSVDGSWIHSPCDSTYG